MKKMTMNHQSRPYYQTRIKRMGRMGGIVLYNALWEFNIALENHQF